MIASLRGSILEKGPNWVLIEVAGIGYRVRATPSLVSDLRQDVEAFIYIYHHVREDAEELFGFKSMADLDLFNSLLSISGVGPKAALTILSVGSSDQVKRAIMTGDLATLTSIPGVGKKTAQKIILELKGQLVEEDSSSGIDSDVLDALVGLGYPAQQAKDALKHVNADDPADKIKEALKLLAK
ncbi:Holliday junction branch migration protein RuvA [Candidatus Uhrbacteria bacterium]|nr:MAG: Holliday junction branch migration protein RuvA [Candidatus Uhrbacteria bacterium]